MMIDPATGWFEIVKIPTFDLNEVVLGKDEYIDKSSSRVIRLFNSTWLWRYLRPRTVLFDKGSDFKKEFTSLLKDLDIKAVLSSVKNLQANAPIELQYTV